MSNNQKDNRNHGGNLSKEKEKVGFEKRNAEPKEDQKKQQTPNEEVPNVGDQEKKGPTVNPNSDASNENENQDDKEEGLAEIVSKDKAE